jgi:hypothetical protein
MTQHFIVTIAPSRGAGRAGPLDAFVGDELLVARSNAPLLYVTRELLRRGAAPTDTVELVTAEDPMTAIAKGSVATAALLTNF